ncbi:MAG: prephenate dehydrogenase [Actinomycetales bacterium]|nr:prephenate dehydrogenase [Actinomycetales bacterium]
MSLDASAAASLGTVRVVGTGLLGTSIALGLRACGVRVVLADPSPTALALARDVGAGEIDDGSVVADLVVVAAPPDVTAGVVAGELAARPGATVTDVASVKTGIVDALAAAGADLDRYVGGHPMAGRERSGPIAARADLFLGRPWVVCPAPRSQQPRVDAVRALVRALGATPMTLTPEAHDAAVAVVSHVPQVAASLVAARLREAPDTAVALAGQGLRDVTRIAGSDATLWAQILAANAEPVLGVLQQLHDDLGRVIRALTALTGTGPDDGARAALARLVEDGRAGRERIPGKHGAAPTPFEVVTVLLPDRPGQMARLFSDIGDAGINVEEFSLEHSPGQPVGLAGIWVLPAVREDLDRALTERGWHVVA